MELALNLGWLALSALAAAAWLLFYTPYQSRFSRGQGLILLLCVSAILFPAISITDDLQELVTYADDHAKRVQEDTVRKSVRPVSSVDRWSILRAFEVTSALAGARRLRSRLFLVQSSSALNVRGFFFIPLVEKRPPPVLLHSL